MALCILHQIVHDVNEQDLREEVEKQMQFGWQEDTKTYVYQGREGKLYMKILWKLVTH